MSWHPTRLTPAQLEARRLAAGRLLRAGRLSQAEIARAFGVSRAAVCQWRRQLERAGLAGLRRRPHPGRPPRLSAGAWRDLGRRLRQGAQAHGFPTAVSSSGRSGASPGSSSGAMGCAITRAPSGPRCGRTASRSSAPRPRRRSATRRWCGPG